MFKKRTILIYGLLFLIILGLLTTIWFFYQKVKNEKKSIEVLRIKVENAQESLAKIEDLQKKYGQLSEAVNQINQTLPDESNIPEVLVQLEKLACQNSLSLFGVNIQDKPLVRTKKKTLSEKQDFSSFYPKGVRYISFNINLIGSYENFKKFLNDLEGNLRIMNVKKINYNIDMVNGNLKINLEIETYYNS